MIDDGSPDGTLEVAKQLQEIYGSDKIVSPLHSVLQARVLLTAHLVEVEQFIEWRKYLKLVLLSDKQNQGALIKRVVGFPGKYNQARQLVYMSYHVFQITKLPVWVLFLFYGTYLSRF